MGYPVSGILHIKEPLMLIEKSSLCSGGSGFFLFLLYFIYDYMAADMENDQSDSERGNPLPPHELLFPISSKGSFICIIPQTGYHITRPLLHQSWSTGWNEE